MSKFNVKFRHVPMVVTPVAYFCTEPGCDDSYYGFASRDLPHGWRTWADGAAPKLAVEGEVLCPDHAPRGTS